MLTNSVSMCMQMFAFGTKALEQFVDRLIEWPQYCNHILQISHLRANHSELVAFIERALARISAAHSESDALHGAAGDQHGAIQASSPNMEVMIFVNLLMFVSFRVSCFYYFKLK